MQYPKISIVTPSYNQAHFLEETIQSVLNQLYPNLEYIIIDGGSADDSVNIIKKYSDRVTYWVSEKDKGQTDAVNKGFRIATGEIIGWINSDDLYLPGAFTTIAEAFNSSDADVIYGDYVLITEEGEEYIKRYEIPFNFNFLVYGVNFIGQPSSFMRRSVLDRFGFLDEKLQYAMDLEYWLRISSRGARFKHIKKFLSKYRLHQSSKTIVGGNEHVAEFNWVRRLYANTQDARILKAKNIYYRVLRQIIKLVYQHRIDYFGGPLFKLMYTLRSSLKKRKLLDQY